MPLALSGEIFRSRPDIGSFFIGLSGSEEAEKRNLLALRRYPSILLQIIFADGTRGEMVLQKRKRGDRVFEDAVAEWLETTGLGSPAD
jgi:hypothetical protein